MIVALILVAALWPFAQERGEVFFWLFILAVLIASAFFSSPREVG
jgi:hypothetical protein